MQRVFKSCPPLGLSVRPSALPSKAFIVFYHAQLTAAQSLLQGLGNWVIGGVQKVQEVQNMQKVHKVHKVQKNTESTENIEDKDYGTRKLRNWELRDFQMGLEKPCLLVQLKITWVFYRQWTPVIINNNWGPLSVENPCDF